jgi:hypothetical protein
LISSLFIEIRTIDARRPLFFFEKTKDNEGKMFIAKLTRKEEECDKLFAKTVYNNLVKKINEKVNEETKEEKSHKEKTVEL